MKLQKYILSAAVALTAFGTGFGLVETGRYLLLQGNRERAKVEKISPTPVEETVITQPAAVQLYELSVDSNDAGPRDSLDLNADYYIIGKTPKGFENFDYLSIETKDYSGEASENNTYGDPILPRGYIFTNQKFKFTRLGVTDKKVSFETERIKGISYRFRGERIRKVINMGEYTEISVFEGRLEKLRDGKTAAASQVKFAVGGC